MNYRALGYTQRKPKEAGVYLISCERNGFNQPLNAQQGWDVALIYFYNGSGGHYDRHGDGLWRIKTLRGVEYSWTAGMWIKGPLLPSGAVRQELNK
jgi:hypothetical protein